MTGMPRRGGFCRRLSVHWPAWSEDILAIDHATLHRRRHLQCRGINVAGLRQAVRALEIKQGSLHAWPVHAVLVEFFATRCAITFFAHAALQFGDATIDRKSTRLNPS